MNKNNRWLVTTDDQGRLILPSSLADKFGLLPGDQMLIEENQDQLFLSRSLNAIRRINIEVTNRCNLNCQTCMRNDWEEPLGDMSTEIFSRLLNNIKSISPVPMIFFGGFGEPLFHKKILDMIDSAKRTGARVEIITNGTLLNENIAKSLIELKLDRLWVSLDGSSPDCYADIRLGAALPQVLENMKNLYTLQNQMKALSPEIGVAFVAMKRNIADLSDLIRISEQFGAKTFSVSNVLAHNEMLQKEMLYDESLYETPSFPSLNLPRLDLNSQTIPVITKILRSVSGRKPNGYQAENNINKCIFLTKASVSVRWDGQVSPCLPLLHTHKAYLDDRERLSKTHSFGSILESDLMDIWQTADYRSFRSRLQKFDFSPCVICNSCEMANDNMEDCFGNDFPTCGGCLWAQGIIQCP